jgi:hypothetical protein
VYSLARILGAARRVIAERLPVDRCSAFLVTSVGISSDAGAHGASPSDMSQRTDAAAELIAAQVTAERRVATIRRASSLLLT